MTQQDITNASASTPVRPRRRWLKPAAWCVWLLVPVAGLAYHVAAGQPHVQRDDASALIAEAKVILERDVFTDEAGKPLDRKARQEATIRKYKEAAGKYAAARAALPDADEGLRLDLRVLELQNRIEAGEIVAAQSSLQSMLAENEATGKYARRENDLREELARASYFIAFAMRREGAAEDEWRPESDIARQQFRHLAEVVGGEKIEDYKRDLETVIRFQRLPNEEADDQDQPGPSDRAGKTGKKRGQKYSKGKSQGQGDIREQVKSDAASSAKRGGKGS